MFSRPGKERKRTAFRRRRPDAFAAQAVHGLKICAGVSGAFPAEHDQLSGKLQFPDNMPVLTAENTVCLGQIRAIHKVKNILRMKMYPKVVIDASAAGLVEHILIGINNL